MLSIGGLLRFSLGTLGLEGFRFRFRVGFYVKALGF